MFFLASAFDDGTDQGASFCPSSSWVLSLPLPRLRRRDRLKLSLALCSHAKNPSPDEMHDFLNAVLFIAGVFKLTVRVLFAGDLLTAFHEINHVVLPHYGLSTGTTAAVMRESVRVHACSNLPGADITSLIPVSRG